MSVREELADCPATYGLAASWVAVFLVMQAVQSTMIGSRPANMGVGSLRAETIHLFGAITWRDFAGGEPWRAITATFVHVNLLHLVLNLIGLVQLGRLIEPWYGGRQFLAICLALGGIGNALGVAMRHGMATGRVWLQARGLTRVLPAFLTEGAPGITENTPAAGGSTVILGLIGLGLVVGWRSRTRVGAFLRDQMLVFLAVTAILGFLGRKFVDNYGHAGGALAGAALGFLHRRLVRSAERRGVQRLAGVVSLGLIVACAGLQARAARIELVNARRLAQSQDCLIGATLADELLQRLVALHPLFEQVANERFLFGLDQALRAGEPRQAEGLDPSPAFELLAVGQLPLSRIEGVKPPILNLLRDRLAELTELHSHLDSRLAGDDLDAVLRIGEEIVSGPIDSRDAYRFRFARQTLERLSLAVRDEWLARRAALESPPPG